MFTFDGGNGRGGPPTPSRTTGNVSMREECAVCGEATWIGTVFYSDRQPIEEPIGGRSYLCALCDERVRAWLDRKPSTGDPPQVDANGLWAIIATLRTDARR